MRQLSLSLFLLLFVSIVPSHADDLDKGRKALVKLEKNANATAADQKSVVDMLKAVTEKSTDKGDMCYGLLTYDSQQRKDYQEAMRQIREKWEANTNQTMTDNNERATDNNE